MEQCRKWDKTIVLITHDIEEALFLSSRILLMTERPTQAFEEIQVPTDHLRTWQWRSEEAFVVMKKALMERMRSKVVLT